VNDCQFYVLLRELRCVAVREVAERLGISYKSARSRLERLTRIGAVEKRKTGRAVLYCLREMPLTVGYARKMRVRVAQVVKLLARMGCAATSVLIRELGISHTQSFYALRLLQAQGCAFEITLVKVAVWCISRNAATKLLEELRETVVRLVEQHRLRYVTPKRLYTLIARDRKAQELFSRVIDVGKPSVAAFSALKALLGATYGDPIGRSVFYAAQPTANASIVREEDVQIPGKAANVKLRLSPDELRRLDEYAREKNMTRSAVIRYAVAEMLRKMKTEEQPPLPAQSAP